MQDIRKHQGIRLLLLMVYLGFLFLANYLTFGVWIPMTGEKGLWFYSAAASILLGNLLVTPFYTKPVDALSYSVLAGTSIYLVNKFQTWGLYDNIIFGISLGFIGIIMAFSLLAIALKDFNSLLVKKFSNSFMILSDFLGDQRIIFSTVYLFALVEFHRDSVKEILILTISWILIVAIEPDKHLWNLFTRIYDLWIDRTSLKVIGTIAAYQTPRMVLVRQPEKFNTGFGEIVAYKDSHATTKVGISLNYVGRDENLLLRIIDINVSPELIKIAEEALKSCEINIVKSFPNVESNSILLNTTKEVNRINEIIGIVDQDTTVERLEFEVINNNELSEGRLVEVDIQGTAVIYQILDGLTKEDILAQKNKYGYSRASALKIGKWNSTKNRFEAINWLPEINTPVFLKESAESECDSTSIGHFPKTEYGVQIKNIHDLVTHNAAILGILGIGKSFLALELVERLIAERIKVIVIDITNEYAGKLPEFYNPITDKVVFQKINEAGIAGKTKVSKNVEEGGSVLTFKELIQEDLSQFLDASNPQMLKIYNPAELEIWRQDSKPFQNEASMASMTPTELTQIITEKALKIIQPLGITDRARVCLIYEEAHSLVPEYSALVAEGDKGATNGTARAILQGRKFGLGCIVVTQRTANVTKTILNQCNTVFAMRTFDDTGKTFLANYIGGAYTNRLSSLFPQQAILYGKSSSCENPVLIQLNNRDDFIRVFRDKYPPPSIEIVNMEEISDSSEMARDDFNTKNESSELASAEETDTLPF